MSSNNSGGGEVEHRQKANMTRLERQVQRGHSGQIPCLTGGPFKLLSSVNSQTRVITATVTCERCFGYNMFIHKEY